MTVRTSTQPTIHPAGKYGAAAIIRVKLQRPAKAPWLWKRALVIHLRSGKKPQIKVEGGH
jgi:hypothetical protein